MVSTASAITAFSPTESAAPGSPSSGDCWPMPSRNAAGPKLLGAPPSIRPSVPAVAASCASPSGCRERDHGPTRHDSTPPRPLVREPCAPAQLGATVACTLCVIRSGSGSAKAALKTPGFPTTPPLDAAAARHRPLPQRRAKINRRSTKSIAPCQRQRASFNLQ